MASAPIEADDGQAQALGADNDVAPQLSEVEQIASEKGWKPKEHYQGPDDLWKPASDFLRHMPGTRDLKREVKDLKGTIDRIAATADRQVKREVREATKEIQARFDAAVDAQDKAGASAAANEMRELEREQSAPSESPETRFANDNPWYGQDDDATAYAVSVSQREAAKGTSVDGQLKAAAAAVKKRFPELFEGAVDDSAKPAPKTLTLNTPGRSVDRGGGKTFADMPPAAKAAADRFFEAAKTRNPDKVPDRKAWDAAYAKDFFAE